MKNKVIIACMLALFSFSNTFAQNNSEQQALTDKQQKETFVSRFVLFVDSVEKKTTFNNAEKIEIRNRYREFNNEYRVVRDQLSEEEIAAYNEARGAFQRKLFDTKRARAEENIDRTATQITENTKQTFKRTKARVKGFFGGGK